MLLYVRFKQKPCETVPARSPSLQVWYYLVPLCLMG